MRTQHLLFILTLGFFSLAGCTAFDDGAATSEDGLMVHHVRNPSPIELDRPVTAKFSKTKRVYGYTFEAKAGAEIQVTFATRAGAGSSLPTGKELDTVVEIYGPVEGTSFGPKLADAEAGLDGSEEALPPSVKLERDGKYLIAFSTWDETGDHSSYTLRAACTGTEFQCRKPLPAGACQAGTKYVRAADAIGTETWRECEVVLLETVVVPSEHVLTIAPGVTVKGNYLGSGDYGNVQLVVNGKLQAVGTPERPVTFTALQNGWKGLVLNGSSNTLENVFVEKAAIGVTLGGSHNALRHISVNSGGLGIQIGPESKGNSASHMRVTKNTNGISFQAGGQAVVEDAVITGNATDAGVGITSKSAEVSYFSRSFVSNFKTGLSLASSALEVSDSTITKNAEGVYVTGKDAGRYRPGCPSLSSPPPSPPPPPSSWPSYDPSFIRTDITSNTSYAVKVDAPELLVVEECNITGNGAGLLNDGVSLHPDSRITKSNIYDNGSSGLQLESFHLNGKLNISGNYWAQISDPALSASWDMSHTLTRSCTTSTRLGSSRGNSFSDGIYRCNYTGYNNGYEYSCSGTAEETQDGAFTFTNFAPQKLEVGPRLDTLSGDVKAARAAE